MAKLSIATPTFGSPKYLESCIDSVYGQSAETVHIVCGGNLSFKKKYEGERVTIITKDPDPGMVACWSNAASMAKTDYIGFIADDNTFEPNYAEVMVSFLETHPECDLVFCNQNAMDSVGDIDHAKSLEVNQFFGRDTLQPGIVHESEYEKILRLNAIPLESCIIRKSVWDKYGPFREESKGSFDQEFLFRMLLSGITIGFLPQYLMNFRWHDDAYSARQRKQHLIGTIWTNENLIALNNKYAPFFKEKNILLKGQLLRYKLEPGQRLKLMMDVLPKKNGLKYVVKNTIARIIGKN